MNQKGIMAGVIAISLAGCATQTPQPVVEAPPVTRAEQLQAQQQQQQQAPQPLGLKRKLAVGRLTNETNYGRSLLREAVQGAEDQKIADMFTQSVANTGQFLVFERQDIDAIRNEQKLLGQENNLVGVDTLVMGSLTQFGRSNTGERGFFSTSGRQEATATVDLRIVDVATGQVIGSVTGTGSSSLEQSRTMGFGSVAGYDGSLNDQAIGAAVNAAVEEMMHLLLNRPWTADILAVEEDIIYFSGGANQGVKSGMVFDVMTKGQTIRSQATGAMVTLPGRKVAELRVTGLFGTTDLDQGAMATLTNGTLTGHELSQLEIREQTTAQQGAR
ncbi:CsgG/HfaB family protein [Aliidiomarina indica]|uniref:CsgG/HfaB family protein n=1 Tax=Aliidiomarina indica TaxID=2749147 RepID=UPI001E35A644|nr:CsgG/HfaB family protein [Aliidiomarina indica]